MSHSNTAVKLPKYQQALESIKNDILCGRYQPGQKLPSEAALVRRFGTSRITVGRALRELRQAGLIKSHAGSGSYVGTPGSADGGLLFGLLIPNLGDTEIFGPICQGMSEAPMARKNALLWGNIMPDPKTKDEQSWQLCQQYIAKKVAGVFFAPIERAAGSDQTHRTRPGRGYAPVAVVSRWRAGTVLVAHLGNLCLHSLVPPASGLPVIRTRPFVT